MQLGQVLYVDMLTRTPWFDRPADNAVFTYEVISNAGPITFTVKVLHKNYDETGNGDNASVTFTQIGSTGFYTGSKSGLKEQIRFELETSGESAGAVLYRIHPPTAYNTANA